MTDKEFNLIASTPITMECFEMDDFEGVIHCHYVWEDLIRHLENLRYSYNETEDERYLKELIRLLPNSYKVVKL